MQIAEIIGLALLLVFVLTIISISFRRWTLSRSGSVDMCWRTAISDSGDGWIFGQGRYEDRGLVLFRSFSPLPIPSRILLRHNLQLGDRRALTGAEPDLLPPSTVILRCTDAGRFIELALAEEALTGLRSWLESVPPGNRGLRGERRGGVQEI